MARKTAIEQQLEDLQTYLDETYLQDTSNRRALAAQGVPLPALKTAPGSDARNPFSGDEPGPASTDANGITAVDARDVAPDGVVAEDDELDALTRETVKLQDATQQRRAADRLKARHPNTDQAQRQATADKIQQALGNARLASQTAQRGIRERVLGAADRLGAVRTPGGIAALLVILWLLLFILVDQNGQPRGVWAWLVLTRKAHLRSEASLAGGSSEQAATASEATTATTATAAQPAGSNVVPFNVYSASSGLDRYISP